MQATTKHMCSDNRDKPASAECVHSEGPVKLAENTWTYLKQNKTKKLKVETFFK